MFKHLICCFAFCLWLLFGCKSKQDSKDSLLNYTAHSTSLKRVDKAKLKAISVRAKQYCKIKKLNSDYFFLIDLSLHSGIKRFFIWDFKKDTIVNSFMVSHGCYKNSWGQDYSKEHAVISNEIDSHCSAIGKYVIAERGISQWGIKLKYNLFGQDSTNSNAFQRKIVLHSWNKITDSEVFPDGTVEGWGCPAVSDNAMRILDEKLKISYKKVLLWIVN